MCCNHMTNGLPKQTFGLTKGKSTIYNAVEENDRKSAGYREALLNFSLFTDNGEKRSNRFESVLLN